MKHRVTCMDCGKTERIEVEKGKHVMSGWAYYGKLNVNACQTDKYLYKTKRDAKDIFDMERVLNACYDPEVKRKLVEMWVCPECFAQGEK